VIAIGDKLISEDILDKQFVCDLNACKGACCVEGDTGAPLEDSELRILDAIYPKIKPYLTPEGIKVLEQEKYVWEPEDSKWKTPLLPTGPCAYVYVDNGVSLCGIEKAWKEGQVDFQKPISCHLYPVRINSRKDFEAVNYERWGICKAACKNGKTLQVPIFRFVKDALIRKYGEEFYDTLEAYYVQKVKA
jgi:hypothetical protein